MDLRRELRPGCASVFTACVVFMVLFVALCVGGCKATGTAVRIEQRRVVGITSAEISEYTIPVISISEGPSVSAYQSRDVPSTVRFGGVAVTTNRTSVLWGMYDSDERKFFRFLGGMGVGSTNDLQLVDAADGTNVVVKCVDCTP